jgi:hypothetical protein
VNIAVVSHDAGSSELLCALISHHLHNVQWHIFALPNSPMAHICQRLNLSFSPIGDGGMPLEMLKPDALFFGTGWQDKIERPFVEHCKKHCIPTVAFLDHWSNYRERFGHPHENWRDNCGDFTVVHDEKALFLATTLGLPNPLTLPNLYLQKLIEDASTKTVTPNQNLLFLSEPTDAVAKATYGDANYWGFTQYSALEDILQNFGNFGCAGLTIRLHPSETGAGFKKITKKYPHIRIQINDAKTFDLMSQLQSAHIIIGFDTMALYTAALMGKTVLSYLPSQSREFLLPLPKHVQFRTLTPLKTSTLTPCVITIDDFGMDFALFLQTVIGKG